MRYALSYTAVVIALFLSVLIYFYINASQQARENMITSQTNRLARIAASHESYITTMLDTAEVMGLSPHIEPFSYEKEPWRAYDLQLQLVPYTATNSFCTQIYLHFRDEDRLYTSSSSMTVDMFTRLMRYASLTPEELSRLIGEDRRAAILPAQQVSSSLLGGSARMVTYLVPLGANPSTSKGSLLFLVDEGVFLDLFSDAVGLPINTYILQGGQAIAARADLPVPGEEALPEGDGTRIFRWSGEDWLQVTLSGQSWGLSYTSVMRLADVNREITEEVFRALSFFPVFVALCLALALWMARRQSKPIQAISGLLTGQQGPQRDELQQISTGIQLLTRRNSELASRLEETLPMQRHHFVLQFIKGRYATREAAEAAALGVGLHIGSGCWAVILCNVPEEGDRPFELGRPPFDGDGHITGAGVELVALKAILYLAFSDAPQHLLRLAETLRTAGKAGGGQCVTSISAVHENYEEAPTAYLEAAAAYDNRFVMGDHQVLVYDETATNIQRVLPRAQTLTNSISQALTLGNRALLDQRIDDLLKFLQNTDMSPFAFRMIYNHVIDMLIRSTAATLPGGSVPRDFYDIFSLSSCQSIDDLDALLRRLCDHLMRQDAEEEAPQEAGDDMDQVVRYMEEHFSDPEISMAAIAEAFDMSTSRLSLSFKDRIGMTPSEYLTLLRTESAKRLLSQTGLTVREISAQVGYYDSGSFTRRFKQLTGETPLQYRHSHGAVQQTGE